MLVGGFWRAWECIVPEGARVPSVFGMFLTLPIATCNNYDVSSLAKLIMGIQELQQVKVVCSMEERPAIALGEINLNMLQPLGYSGCTITVAQ